MCLFSLCSIGGNTRYSRKVSGINENRHRSGSSDYHGTGKPNLLGENTTDPEVFAALVEQATGVDVITA